MVSFHVQGVIADKFSRKQLSFKCLQKSYEQKKTQNLLVFQNKHDYSVFSRDTFNDLLIVL